MCAGRCEECGLAVQRPRAVTAVTTVYRAVAFQRRWRWREYQELAWVSPHDDSPVEGLLQVANPAADLDRLRLDDAPLSDLPLAVSCNRPRRVHIDRRSPQPNPAANAGEHALCTAGITAIPRPADINEQAGLPTPRARLLQLAARHPIGVPATRAALLSSQRLPATNVPATIRVMALRNAWRIGKRRRSLPCPA